MALGDAHRDRGRVRRHVHGAASFLRLPRGSLDRDPTPRADVQSHHVAPRRLPRPCADRPADEPVVERPPAGPVVRRDDPDHDLEPVDGDGRLGDPVHFRLAARACRPRPAAVRQRGGSAVLAVDPSCGAPDPGRAGRTRNRGRGIGRRCAGDQGIRSRGGAVEAPAQGGRRHPEASRSKRHGSARSSSRRSTCSRSSGWSPSSVSAGSR